MSLDLNKYKAVLAELEEQLAGIEDERAKLEIKHSALQETISGMRRLIGLTNGSKVPPQTDAPVLSRTTFKDLKIVPATKKYLEMMKRGQTTRELATAFEQGGFKSESKNLIDTIRSILRRDSEKENPTVIWKDGKWELAEWHSRSGDKGHQESAAQV
jgi:propanediol dehydratase large subunit